MTHDGNVEIIVKLFDTLKESSTRTTEALNDLISQQSELISHVKHLPIEDLQNAIKEHSKDTNDEFIKSAEKAAENSNKVLEKIKNIDSKLSKVLIVISVAFALSGCVYFLVRSTIDTDKIMEKIEDKQNTEHNKLMEEIKNEIEKLHKQ